jgi:tetratricopeptide (TPR) repeat protein
MNIKVFIKAPALWVSVFLVVLTFAAYWQVFYSDFIDFDDDLYVTENSNVQAGLTWQGIKWAFTTTHAYNWHPLVWLSHMLDCQLYNLNPVGHHFTNLLFHIANTLLLFLVFKSMTGRLWPSAFVAALFALHPLHVESVAWVSERKDVLSTFFWLLTIHLYVRYVRRPKFVTYMPVVLALVLGLMAKQMLVTLPFVLLLLDYWPLQRFPQSQQKRRRSKGISGTASFSYCFAEKIPLLILCLIASLIVLLIQSEVTLVKTAAMIPIKYRLGNALIAYAKYITKMFWPVNLGILYPHPIKNIVLWQVLAAASALSAISFLVVRARRSHKWLIVGWFWFLGTLVPVIGLVQVGLQEMADRYTYVPLIGLFVIIAWGAADLLAKQRYRTVLLATASLVVLSVLTALTWLQLTHWRNSISLFQHTVAVTANNDILHYNLGILFLQDGKTDEAIKHWSRAVNIKPDQPTIHRNLAMLLAQQGRLDQAIEHYRLALEFRPDDRTAYEALTKLLAARKKLDAPKRKDSQQQ